MMTRAGTGAAVLVALSLHGCASPNGAKPRPVAAQPATTAVEPVRWPFWPATLRVHPLTRLVTNPESGETVLEARIELRDAEEGTTKGVGLLSLELRSESDRTGVVPRAAWEVDLALPEENRLHFDDVTRTYLLRLELEPGQLPEWPVLSARFDSADGRTLEGRLLVRTR